jgi:hypothetical protein
MKLLWKGSQKMNMQVYHQIASINSKVKKLRSLMAQVETQQSSLQQLLHYNPDKQSATVAAPPPSQPHDIANDLYVEKLIRTGRLT